MKLDNNIKILGILLIVCGSLFYKVMFDSYLFLSSDSLSARSVAQGIDMATQEYNEYPIWMPWMFGGLPSTHSMQNISEYYFPHQIISIIKSMGIPWFWNFIFHFLFCGFGMYFLLKRLKLGFYSSALGAVCFMITPWMIVNIVHGHGSQVMTAAYLPWVMWATLKLKERPDIRNISILALLIGLQLQRGHVQIAYYTWIVMGMYIIYDYISSKKIDTNFLFKWIISSAIGLCMSLWIYIPLLNYTPYSIRSISGGGASFDYATHWSLHPYEMLTMILPSSYGFGDASYFGYMPFTSFPNYVGCLLIILAIFSFYKNTHNKIVYFFLFLSLFSLAVAFGKYFFFYGMLFDWLPYFNKFRVPSMILVVFQFSILALASIGLNNLLDKIKQNEHNKSILRIILIASGFIILFSVLRYFFYDVSHKQFQDPAINMIINEYRLSIIRNDIIIISILLTLFISSLIAVINKKINIVMFSIGCLFFSVADIYLVDKKIINPGSPYSLSVIKHKKYLDAQLKNDDIIDFLNSDKSKYRVLPIGELGDNRLVAFNIESITGYHPAKLASYELLDKNVGMNDNVLKMMNVKYLLSTQRFPEEQAADLSLKRVKSGKYYNNFQYKDIYVYEYLKLGRRAQFLSNLGFIDSKDEGYNLLKRAEFNIIKNSFISKNDYEDYMSSISYNENSTLNIKKWSPNKIIIETNAVGPTDEKHFVLLSEIYFPYGWKIEGDDNIKIIEVNNLLRGFFVSSGENEIILSFDPVDLKYGSILTYSSFILILLMLFISYRRLPNERI